MKKPLCAVLLATAICMPAWAASMSTAKITRIQVLVTDINPTDGVGPSFDFDNFSSPISVASGWVGLGADHQEQSVMSSWLGQPKSVALGDGRASMGASFVPDIYGSASLTASGSALWADGGQGPDAYYGASAYWDSPPFYQGFVNLRIGAGVRVQIRVLTDVQAHTTIGAVADGQGDSDFEWAGASAYVEIGALAADGSTVTSKQETRLLASFTHPVSLAQSGWLEASFENTASAGTTGILKLGVNVWGGSLIPMSAVPESATLPYGAAGLAFMAPLLRRRQRADARAS